MPDIFKNVRSGGASYGLNDGIHNYRFKKKESSTIDSDGFSCIICMPGKRSKKNQSSFELETFRMDPLVKPTLAFATRGSAGERL